MNEQIIGNSLNHIAKEFEKEARVTSKGKKYKILLVYSEEGKPKKCEVTFKWEFVKEQPVSVVIDDPLKDALQ